jgi:polyribonucleotide 5'-hydroxyl-kinase
VSGTAECIGTELAPGVRYTFKGEVSSCIFTWHGCVIEIEGECHAYSASETPMNFYANLHGYLQVGAQKELPF